MRLTTQEFRDLKDAGDWKGLWVAATPYVKFAASSLRSQEPEDLLQQGLLIAGPICRKWDPDAGTFPAFIYGTVRRRLLNHLRDTWSRDFTTISADLGDEVEPEGDDDLQPKPQLAYADLGATPAGFRDQVEELARMGAPEAVDRLLGRLSPETGLWLRELWGLPVLDDAEPPKTHVELARSRGVPRGSVAERVKKMMKTLVESQSDGYKPITTTSSAPEGRKSWRTNLSAYRWPGYYQGLASAMGDTTAWRESVGTVWGDWSWKPTAADIERGCRP